MPLTLDEKEYVRELLRKGLSTAEIAEEMGIGKMQVAGIKAHMTITKNKNSDISKPHISKKEDLKETPTKEDPDPIPLLWRKTKPPKNLSHQKADTSILIGTDQIFNKKVYWDFHPKRGSVNPHVLIVGETGFGKTYATQCMLAELNKKGVTSVIFDYGQGFGVEEASQDFLRLTNPKQIEASRNGISLNPLEIFPDDIAGPVNVAQRTADTFCRVYPKIGIQQKEAIIEAVQDAFTSVGIDPNKKETWNRPLPQFITAHHMLGSIAVSEDHLLKNPAKTAYSHISSFFRFNIIRNSGLQLSWDKIIKVEGGTWIIQLKGLDHYVSMIITEMLLWNLISYLQSEGPSGIKLFIVLDEAHKLSFDIGTPVEWILREGRKFGVGAILASQQVEDYSKVAISNTATKLVFQNHDYRYQLSKALAKKCRNISDYKSISKIITRLERGKAFFYSKNVGRIVNIDNLIHRGHNY